MGMEKRPLLSHCECIRPVRARVGPTPLWGNRGVWDVDSFDEVPLSRRVHFRDHTLG